MTPLEVPGAVSATSADSAPFWDAARRGELVVVRCAACGAVSHPPLPRCPECGGSTKVTEAIAGHGRLYASSVVEHQVSPEHPVPYTVVLVDVDDAPGLRLVGSIPGRAELHPGEEMICRFEVQHDGVARPQWRPTRLDPMTASDATR